jgi:FAD dependent oxidoreductase TIGR03364
VRNFGQAVSSGLTAGKWQQYGLDTLQLYKGIQAEFDLGIRNNGSYYIASNADELQLIEELYAINQQNGYECHILSKADCLQRFAPLREDYCLAALYFPLEVSIEPRVMIHRLLAYLQLKYPDTFTYLPNTPIIGCASVNGKAIAESTKGEQFQTGKIIICSGREFRMLYPEVYRNSDLVVSKLQMMQTFPMPEVSLPGNILTGLSIRRYESFEQCPSWSSKDNSVYKQELFDHGIHILFKQAIDGSIIIGDSHEYAPAAEIDRLGFDVNHEINELILEEAKRIVNLPDWRIQKSWNGYYAQVKNGDLFHHHIDENIQIVTGIGGKGMTSGLGLAGANIKQTFAL